MAAELVRYVQGHLANIPATTNTTLLTPNGPTKVALRSLVVFNPTAAAINVTVHVRQTTNGVVDAAATTNEIVNESLAAKARLVLSGTPYLVLANGAVISVFASAVGLNAWAAAEVAERDR